LRDVRDVGYVLGFLRLRVTTVVIRIVAGRNSVVEQCSSRHITNGIVAVLVNDGRTTLGYNTCTRSIVVDDCILTLRLALTGAGRKQAD
jgi:biotin synthase-like enzyme